MQNTSEGLGIECAAIVLVTILTLLLARSIRLTFLNYWACSWACHAVALFSLSLAFVLPSSARCFHALYFLGSLAACYLLLAGCRNLASQVRLKQRDWFALLPAAAASAVLASCSAEFLITQVPHRAIISGFWIAAFFALSPARRQPQRGPGLAVVSVALALLALDFFQVMPICGYAAWSGNGLSLPYLRYSSLYDMMLEILLAFGLVMVASDQVRKNLESANEALAAASRKLRIQAEQDPLTGALNRHALQALVQRTAAVEPDRSGCIAVVDLDSLKSINDRFGHLVGDAAICSVANALRSVVRGDDPLFRWGGDEFLLLLVGLKESEARSRLERVNTSLAVMEVAGLGDALTLSMSYGVSPFASIREWEQATEHADQEMYERKQMLKTARLSGREQPVGAVDVLRPQFASD